MKQSEQYSEITQMLKLSDQKFKISRSNTLRSLKKKSEYQEHMGNVNTAL